MSLRTKLIGAFLILAIVPLSGIVFYSYRSSLDAFRQAVEAETAELTRDITRTMDAARRDLRQRFSRIGEMTMSDAQTRQVEDAVGEAMADMASSSAWIEAVRVIPEVLSSPAPDVEAPQADQDPPPEGGPSADALPWMPPPGHAEDWRELIEHLASEMPKVRLEFERARRAHQEVRARDEQRLERERAAAEERRDRLQRLFGDDFETAVRSGDRVLGRVEADISISKFLRSVLIRGRRARGEIPFAVDPASPEAEPYTVNDEDRAVLLGLTNGDAREFCTTFAPDGEERYIEWGDWIAVTRQDPSSSIIFGIARPIGESLAQIRQTAVRNLALGSGMIFLALLGILPLSGRMTHELQRLNEQVDQLATGDLSARATAGGRDEIGQLARSFNRMASDLEDNQERLLEQERDAREREVREELLAAENERRGEELEAARHFQLSLLPRTLPHHDDWEVAVLMRTATEVGGDYYDFCAGEHGLTAAVGDAAGHGARAGTMVAVLKTLFTSCESDGAPQHFLEQAAETIRDMRLDRMTMSMVVAQCEAGSVTLSSAGMPPALLRRSGGAVEEVSLGGLPLGTNLGATYDSVSIDLQTGDCLLLMSDGFAELPDRNGELVGYGAVGQLLAETDGRGAAEVIDRLTVALDELVGERAPADDVTFVAVRRVG